MRQGSSIDGVGDHRQPVNAAFMRFDIRTHPPVKLSELLLQSFDYRGFPGAIRTRLIPVIDLQTDEHAEDDDQRFDQDSDPILLAKGSGETAQDH